MEDIFSCSISLPIHKSESHSRNMEPHHGHKRMKPTFWCDGCHKDFRSSRDYNIHVERGRSCVIQVKTVADNGGKNSRDGDSRNAQPDQKENNHTGEEICNMNYSSEGEGVREFVDDSVESTDAFHTRPSAPADIRITRFQRQSTLPNNPASIKGNKVASPDGDPGDFCQPHVEESLNAKKETSSITDLVGVDLLSHLMLDLKLSNFQLSSLVAPILAGPARELLEVVPLGRGPLSADQVSGFRRFFCTRPFGVIHADDPSTYYCVVSKFVTKGHFKCSIFLKVLDVFLFLCRQIRTFFRLYVSEKANSKI